MKLGGSRSVLVASKCRGITLIEALVVAEILSLLFVLISPAVSKAMGAAI